MTNENGGDDEKSVEIRLDDHIPPVPMAVTVTKKTKRAPKPRAIFPPQRPVIGSIGHSARQLLNQKAIEMYSDDESVYLSDNNEEMVDADAPIGETNTTTSEPTNDTSNANQSQSDKEEKDEHASKIGDAAVKTVALTASELQDLPSRAAEHPSADVGDKVTAGPELTSGLATLGASEDVETANTNLSRLAASNDKGDAVGEVESEPSSKRKKIIICLATLLVVVIAIVIGVLVSRGGSDSSKNSHVKSPDDTVALQPTKFPSYPPSITPSAVPSVQPTLSPTLSSSPTTTPLPTKMESASPSIAPSTPVPTANPTEIPTANPTEIPTPVPTANPTEMESASPSIAPSTPVPTANPTEIPSMLPSVITISPLPPVPAPAPSIQATERPTATPTRKPTAQPTRPPTPLPTVKPNDDRAVWINNLKPFFGNNFPSTQTQTAVLNELVASDNWEPNNPSNTRLWMERFVLSLFYKVTRGEDWNLSVGWRDSTTGVCDWFGVECDPSDRVVSIKSQFNALEGSLPSELGLLGELTELGLQRNKLTGTIPREIGNLVKLEKLDLRNNRLQGAVPAEVENLAVSYDTEVLLSRNALDCRGGIPNLEC